ncbi:MAG: HNH endonuclease [Ketobacter sp.]|nr:HNH endonuclease [Ketobacter sp.]
MNCSIDNCTKPVKARGWCGKHYTRWQRYGNTSTVKYNLKPLTWEYLLECSKTNIKTGCIEWQKGLTEGYGKTAHGGKHYKAHRVSWTLNRGPIPPGMFVLHTCDSPPCVNPDHLFLGTHQDNMADKVSKGRQSKGETHIGAKLTESKALAIKYSEDRNVDIAKAYSISPRQVGKIKKGTAWRHLKKHARILR